MSHANPLRTLHQQAEASFVHYGPPESGVELVETFGEIEAEYAAIRKGCAVIDAVHRGTVEVTGADRIEFLNRMLTQELRTLTPHHCVRSFWLNRRGRIDADLRLIELGDRAWMDMDVLSSAHAVETLASFVFSEDVAFREATSEWRRLWVHGPTAPALLGAVATHVARAPASDLAPGGAAVVRIADREVVVVRDDTAGEVGLHFIVRTEDVERVYHQLIETGSEHDANGNAGTPQSRIRLKPAGWRAFNIARIEAGTPLYNIDFGAESLPAETGVLEDRVSFTKGCYLGQEIVARMHALGHPKQRLVAVRIEPGQPAPSDAGGAGEPVRPLPPGSAQVFTEVDGAAEIVGGVTSSTLSPMLGSEPVCFAQIKWKWSDPGTRLMVSAEGVRAPCVVQDSLAFWKRA